MTLLPTSPPSTCAGSRVVGWSLTVMTRVSGFADPSPPLPVGPPAPWHAARLIAVTRTTADTRSDPPNALLPIPDLPPFGVHRAPGRRGCKRLWNPSHVRLALKWRQPTLQRLVSPAANSWSVPTSCRRSRRSGYRYERVRLRRARWPATSDRPGTTQVLPDQRGCHPARRGPRPRSRRRVLRRPQGRDARDSRRKRMRQDDARPLPDRVARAHPRRCLLPATR